MIVHDVVQYSPEFWEARKGYPTASCFDKVMTAVRCELSASADEYIHELIGDKHNLIPNFFSETNRPKSRAMEYGSETEAQARDWYRCQFDEYEVQQVGFVTNDEKTLGCSPDGFILKGGEIVGVLELKCPMPKTHVKYLTKRTEVPTEYKPQVHGHLIVTGLPFVEFVSFCPGFPAVVVRVTPNEYTAKLRACLDKFLLRYAEVEALLAGPQAAARPREAVA
jgi:hypothetical protein